MLIGNIYQKVDILNCSKMRNNNASTKTKSESVHVDVLWQVEVLKTKEHPRTCQKHSILEKIKDVLAQKVHVRS